MKAFITASFTEDGLARLRRHMEVVHEDWKASKKIFFDGAELAARLNELGADVLIVEADLAHEEVLNNVPLKLIGACRGDPINVGVARATELGIPVLFTPARNADAVADLTLAYMLALARHLYTVNLLLKTGQMRFESAKDYLGTYERYGGFELNGCRIGIVGFGAIGRRVLQRVLAFGAKASVCDPFVPADVITAAGATAAPLAELVREADILTLHCPDTPENYGLISAQLIRSMKPGAFFLNLARAAIVDDDALYEALSSGRLAGAGLDVFADEPVNPENRYVKLPNVLVTPHLGGATRDVVRHQSEMIADDVEAWLAGRRPKHICNPQVLK